MRGVVPARNRTVSCETNASPNFGSTRGSTSLGDTCRVVPGACLSLASTGIVTTSPARTTAVSSFATGGSSLAGAGIGMTITSPSAVLDPFEIR